MIAERPVASSVQPASATGDCRGLLYGRCRRNGDGVLLAMVIEGLIPDDVEYAFAEQQAIQKRIDAEFEQGVCFPDRNTGLPPGAFTGTPVDEADEGYLKWLLGRPDIKPKAKSILMKALGQVEQIGLF